MPLPPLRLGKLPPRLDPRTLMFAKYRRKSTRNPAHIGWHRGVDSWPVLANDQVGDCAIAAMGHHIQGWTHNEGPDMVVLDDQTILAAYSEITGYNPARPETDQGTVMLDALRYWRKSGIGGRKIEGFTKVGGSSEVREAIWVFGGAYVGLSLPLTARDQLSDGQPWSVANTGPTGQGRPGSWGGHAVAILGYDRHRLTCVTWGAIQKMTWGFFETYCDEAYAVLSPNEWARDGLSPSGFNLDALRSDLSKL